MGLILITLPIGNLEDISIRAKKALEVGHYFAAEDERSLRKLMTLLGISPSRKSIESFHDHSHSQSIKKILAKAALEDVYVVSDAGSPLLSDPAFPLVREAIDQGIEVDSFPGSSAVVLSLELSGLPPSPFLFHGFFPRQKKEQLEYIRKFESIYSTHVFFESPLRLIKTIELIFQRNPRFQVSVVREGTKKFQTIYRWKDALEFNEGKEAFVEKGEVTVVIYYTEGTRKLSFSDEVLTLAKNVEMKGNRSKDVAKLLSEILGKPTKEIYDRWNQMS